MAAVPLTKQTPWDGVQEWLGEAFSDSPGLLSQLCSTLGGSQPDGEILLTSTTKELQEGLNLSFILAKKLRNRLDLAEQAEPSGSQLAPASQSSKRPAATGSQAAGNAKRAKPLAAEPPAAAVDAADADNGSAAAAGAAPAEDAADAHLGAPHNPSPPSAPPTGPKSTGRRGRPRKQQAAKAARSSPAVAMEVDPAAGDCAVNLALMSGGANDAPANGTQTRRSTRKAATAARALLSTVVAAETASNDNFTAATLISAMKQVVPAAAALAPAREEASDDEQPQGMDTAAGGDDDDDAAAGDAADPAQPPAAAPAELGADGLAEADDVPAGAAEQQQQEEEEEEMAPASEQVNQGAAAEPCPSSMPADSTQQASGRLTQQHLHLLNAMKRRRGGAQEQPAGAPQGEAGGAEGAEQQDGDVDQDAEQRNVKIKLEPAAATAATGATASAGKKRKPAKKGKAVKKEKVTPKQPRKPKPEPMEEEVDEDVFGEEEDEEMAAAFTKEEQDSDYNPSMELAGKDEEAEEEEEALSEEVADVPLTRGRSTRQATGRRRATGHFKEEDIINISDDTASEGEEVDVEEVEDAEDCWLLPRKEDDDLPEYEMVYCAHKAEAGFRMILQGIPDVKGVKHLSTILQLGISDKYMGRRKNQDTGLMESCERKRTVTQWRKEVLKQLDSGVFSLFTAKEAPRKAQLVEAVLTEMANDADGAMVLRRYLENCFGVYPEIEPDNSNLAQVVLSLWHEPQQEPGPRTCLLGVRIIHIVPPRAQQDPWAGTNFSRQGAAPGLYKQLMGESLDGTRTSAPTFKLNPRKHKGGESEKQEIADWLLEACKAPAAVRVSYKSFVDKQDYHIEVRVELTTQEVTVNKDLSIDPEAPAAAHLQHLSEPCDLLALYAGLDHVRGKPMHAKRLERAEQLVTMYQETADELRGEGVKEAGQGPDGQLNVGQMADLLEYCEGLAYDDHPNLKRVLKRLRLPLMQYQKQALSAIMLEEQGSGSAKHLWLELPLPLQSKYDPDEIRANLEQAEEERRARRAEDDEEYDYSDSGDEDEDLEARTTRAQSKKEAAQREREARAARRMDQAREEQLQGGASAACDRGFLVPSKEKQAEDRKPGIRPKTRLFYSAALSSFVWGTNLKDLMLGSSLRLPLQRGIMCCLDVGMGKTAVALAAARQSNKSCITHAGLPVEPGVWRDELLYDGYDGYPGHLLRGGTLIVAPMTLLPQWEGIEIDKFLGSSYHNDNVVNSRGVQGKKRPMVPRDLTKFSMVLVNPETLLRKEGLPMYSGVLWERVVVDEAHQEPGLLDKLVAIPKRSLICLTGTPVVEHANDVQQMLKAMGLPSYNILSRNAWRMGYLLSLTMIRYTGDGNHLTGETNMPLPPKTERALQVAWGGEEAKYKALEAYCQGRVDEYMQKVTAVATERNHYLSRGKDLPRRLQVLKPATYTVQPMVVLSELRPMRHACAGGIAVTFQAPRAIAPRVKPEPGTDAYYEQYEQEEGSEEEGEGQAQLVELEVVFNAKIRALISEIRKLQEDSPDTKMVVFSCFPDTLNAVKEALEPEGFNFRTMTSNMSLRQRAAALKDFLTDPPTTIFLLSTALASVGLTLTSANHMFLMEPALNPQQELQAVGRIYRMGQTKPVTITRMVMEDSVEERIRGLLERRHRAERVQGEGEGFSRPANTKVKPRGKKNRNAGEDVTGVAAVAKTHELRELFGGVEPRGAEEDQPDEEAGDGEEDEDEQME